MKPLRLARSLAFKVRGYVETQEVLRVNSVNSSGDLVKLILREFS